jgi:hypothetical protein
MEMGKRILVLSFLILLASLTLVVVVFLSRDFSGCRRIDPVAVRAEFDKRWVDQKPEVTPTGLYVGRNMGGKASYVMDYDVRLGRLMFVGNYDRSQLTEICRLIATSKSTGAEVRFGYAMRDDVGGEPAVASAEVQAKEFGLYLETGGGFEKSQKYWQIYCKLFPRQVICRASP